MSFTVCQDVSQTGIRECHIPYPSRIEAALKAVQKIFQTDPGAAPDLIKTAVYRVEVDALLS